MTDYMRTADFNFALPTELIAQSPVNPRDSSRLMVVDRTKRTIEHRHFYDIVDYLGPNDLIVWNNSKVFKARLHGRIFLDEETDDIDNVREAALHPTDAIINAKMVELFLVRPMENHGVWQALAKPAKKLRLGYKIVFAPDFSCTVIEKEKSGTLLVQFSEDAAGVRAKANKYGQVPTPPYVQEKNISMPAEQLAQVYQTVYAKPEGSVAAPTAGFHFTPGLIEKLKQKGVAFAEITLHVGLGTFLPVKAETIEEHTMHPEQVEITAENAAIINQAKMAGKRIIAVGTTTVRTLEGAVLSLRGPRGAEAIPSQTASIQSGDRHAPSGLAMTSTIQTYNSELNIFIYPGFKFQIVDALITNFHLPESTLLMLVSAFAAAAPLGATDAAGDRLVGRSLSEGREFMLQCYNEAIKEKYRFYSFGDAMLIK